MEKTAGVTNNFFNQMTGGATQKSASNRLKSMNMRNSTGANQLPPKTANHPQTAVSQARRNIQQVNQQQIGGGGSTAGGFRPKTAANPINFNNPRPPTAANGFNFVGNSNFNRARTAAVPGQMNPKIKRYEEVIIRLKRLLAQEKRTLRRVRTVCSKEIEVKGGLEKILRACVDDVKNEIAKKRA